MSKSDAKKTSDFDEKRRIPTFSKQIFKRDVVKLSLNIDLTSSFPISFRHFWTIHEDKFEDAITFGAVLAEKDFLVAINNDGSLVLLDFYK